MTLGWTEPGDKGSCPILGYRLYIDDGITGDASALVTMDNDQPSLDTVVVPFIDSEKGNTYTFKLTAYNLMGDVSSTQVAYLYAVEPDTPASGPQEVSSSSTSISVQFDQALSSNGGSPIISYNLQYKGAFTDHVWLNLTGDPVDNLLTTYTVSPTTKSETYLFRYRVKNSRGWSEFSPETQIIAADAPSKPASAPVLTTIPTATTIEL
jgi:hypothetical protein